MLLSRVSGRGGCGGPRRPYRDFGEMASAAQRAQTVDASEECEQPSVVGPRLQRVLGQVSLALGDAATALPLLTGAADWARRELAAGDPKRLQALFELGRGLLERGDVAAAEEQFTQCLAESRAGADDADFAAECNEALGSCASVRGDPSTALRHYEALFAVWQHADASRHARSLTHLARTHAQLGDDERAQDEYDRALALLRGLDEPLAHAELAISVGVFHGAHGRNAEAEALFRDALAEQTRVCGESHPVRIYTSFNLANALLAQKRIDDATPVLEQAVALGDRLALQKDAGFANALCLLGTLRLLQEDPARAVPLYERGIAMLELLRGRDSPSLRVPLNNLGHALQTLGETEKLPAIRARLDALRPQ